jgi:glycosyltransferase involved in cell wall biosynthesis
MRVLLLSAYAAQSHRYWQGGLRQMFPQWDWTELALPPRHFSWRIRGNPLYWSLVERQTLETPYDLLIATSMVDLATLRGLVPALAHVPSLLYFHENQFEYPQDRQQHSLLEAQMVSLYAALAADGIAFNSRYNMTTFMKGCKRLLNRFPDRVPSGIVARLQDKARVLPVPLLPPAGQADSDPRDSSGSQWDWSPGALRVLWSARFEHDKGGEGLYRLLQTLEQEALHYQLAVTGQQFRNSPSVFARIEQDFATRLVHFGFIASPLDYSALLHEADIIVSTALHEFQGLAVMQAVAAGCLPLVPDRLAYRETYADPFRYPSCPDDPRSEAQGAVQRLLGLSRERPTAPDLSAFDLSALRERYREVLLALRERSTVLPGG